MQLRSHHKRTFALAALGALAAFGCHTWQGVNITELVLASFHG